MGLSLFLAPNLSCVFVCGLLDLCVSDRRIAATAGCVCFLGELAAEEETGPEAHYGPEA